MTISYHTKFQVRSTNSAFSRKLFFTKINIDVWLGSEYAFVHFMIYDLAIKAQPTLPLHGLWAYPTLWIQSWTEHLERGKKTEGNWTGLENFNICFCVSFSCYCQSFICGKETGRWAMPPPVPPPMPVPFQKISTPRN